MAESNGLLKKFRSVTEAAPALQARALAALKSASYSKTLAAEEKGQGNKRAGAKRGGTLRRVGGASPLR